MKLLEQWVFEGYVMEFMSPETEILSPWLLNKRSASGRWNLGMAMAVTFHYVIGDNNK